MQAPPRRFHVAGSSQLTTFDFLSVPDQTETLFQSLNRQSADDFTAVDDDHDANALFGTLRGNVVGLRYYSGVVNKNEMVSLVRQPDNPYDRNAVQVNNVYGDQVGHIKKELALPMAYIMDNKLAKVEGIVPFGTTNAFSMPVQLHFWGKEEHKASVVERLSRSGFKLCPPSKSTGFETSSYGAGSMLVPKSFRVSPGCLPVVQMTADQLHFWGKEEHKASVVERLSRSGFKLCPPSKSTGFETSSYGAGSMLVPKSFRVSPGCLPVVQMTADQAVSTVLLAHQKQALAWMVSRENNNDLPPFWEQKNDIYYNLLTNFGVKERPERVLGGILSDDMGLGKTLSMIALILTNFHKGMPLPLEKIDDEETTKGDIPLSVATLGGLQKKTTEEPNEKVKTDEAVKSTEVSAGSSRSKRQKAKVTYTYSSDSEGSIDGVSPKKKSKAEQKQGKNKGGSSKGRVSSPMECFDFAAALETSAAASTSKRKVKKKGAVANAEMKGRATLIICPLSVLSNWIDQFEQHVRPNVKLSVYLYYGSDRSRDPSFLSSQDIVVTTYNVLAADFGNKNDSPLHKVDWLRVVLDEGHTIRNPNALQTKAVLDLKAERRWVLTGTPIQNSLKDLWTLISFLKLKPFTVKEWWNRTIQRPSMMGDPEGFRQVPGGFIFVAGLIFCGYVIDGDMAGKPITVSVKINTGFSKGRLQALIKSITLRRTKASKINGRPVVELPERKVFIQHITLSEEEKQLYESVRKEGRTVIGRYFSEGSVLTNYADVLAILVRLRQLCCHPRLFGSSALTVDSKGSDEECAICLDSLRSPVITYCAHVYCKPCICQVIRAEQNAKCPLCRAEIKVDQLVEYPVEKNTSESLETKDKWLPSSKVDALMRVLLKLREEDSSVKSLVVSQFTKFLSLIEIPLREAGFSFARLDGSMSQKKRAAAIQAFQNSERGTPTIMLLSLKAGGVGLNLTAASRVFLMDPAWNPAAEDQCFDRCHRLGQTRDVIITKFIVKDSVEENMTRIQKKKRDLAERAFESKNTNEMKQARIDEIRTLMDI
ncbi:Helicase-like transcription factor [Acipenser ruthenus]|uniref:Helicase-like transcription factor n=1 Tax=Acipenser ruthenus TaxID=7906 RepID=A0A444TWY9_ACIRT|nr:Helicase-like transcription factor [Acipenser ruthenus]